MEMEANLGKRRMTMILSLIILVSVIGVSTGAHVYKVGDSSGWTTIGNVDYTQWAVTKTFQVGDIIVFEYNPQFHNVVRVTHAEYKACNATFPMSTHTTGNDSITIDARGHHFFICGVPGHCQAGQKVDINVPRAPLVATGPSRSLPSPAPKTAASVQAPSPSNAATVTVLFTKFDPWLLLLLLTVFFS